GEGEAAHAQSVELRAGLAEDLDRFVHRGARRAVIDDTVAGRFLGVAAYRARHQILRRVELAQQSLHVVDVGTALLGVAGVAVAGRAAREERAARGMRARIGAVGNAVAVDVAVTAEILARLEILRAHHLSPAV